MTSHLRAGASAFLLVSLTSCASLRQQVEQAISRHDDRELVALQRRTYDADDEEDCLEFLLGCESASQALPPACIEEAKSNACLHSVKGSLNDSPHGFAVYMAHGQLEERAVKELGGDVDTEREVNKALARDLERPWNPKQRLALFDQLVALQRVDKPRGEFKAYQIQVVTRRAELADQAIAQAAAQMSIATANPSDLVTLYESARRVEGNQSPLESAYKAAGLGGGDSDQAARKARAAQLAAGDVVGYVRAALRAGARAEARSQLLAATKKLGDAGDFRGAGALASELDPALAEEISDLHLLPAPWGALRHAARTREATAPATAALLRRALRSAPPGIKLPGAAGAVQTWFYEKTLIRVEVTASCGMERVRGEGTKGHTTTSRVQYRDGSGTEERITTTTTPDTDGSFYEVPIENGEFALHLGTFTQTVPFACRNQAKDVMGLGRVKLANARQTLLNSLRAEMEAHRDTVEADELAAQLLLLSDRLEPRAVDYLRGRFGLPAPAANDGWSSPTAAVASP